MPKSTRSCISRIGLFLRNLGYLTRFNLKHEFTDTDHTPQQIWHNMPFEVLGMIQRAEIQLPNVADRFETLEQMVVGQHSVCRFGDGELNVAMGQSIPFQTASPVMASRLQEILKSNRDDVMVCLSDAFGSLAQYTDEVQSFWRRYNTLFRAPLYEIFDLEKQYYDTYVSRPYIDYKDKSFSAGYYEKLKMLWAGHDVILIEGGQTRMGIGNDLLAGCRSVQRVICPGLNAFDQYADILEESLKHSDEHLFLVCLGPTATVLAYDLGCSGRRAIDIGHLDVEYEWFKAGVQERVRLKGKFVLEAEGGTDVANISDHEYESQIIARIV